MDSPAVSRALRRLFSHEVCSRQRFTGLPRNAAARGLQPWVRSESTSPKPKRVEGSTPDSDWHVRDDMLTPDKTREFARYPWLTANELRDRRQRPRRVKMLMRDFIEDSLYNPNYGYFSTQAVIFTPGQPFDFNDMKDEQEFHKELGRRYTSFEDRLDEQHPNDTRQLWHTPTELFKPYFGEAIARFMVENYSLTQYPYHDLIIYEMGAGNGTLMLNVLDHIRNWYPEIYARTKFKVIEISKQLASLQNSNLLRTANSRGHLDHVEIVNKSVFDWDTFVPEPCWFLAMEVFDNFAHDAIRYNPLTEQALQAAVMIDNEGEFYEFYLPELDPVAARFLRVRNTACEQAYNHPLRGPAWWRNIRYRLPMAPNLTQPEYIPTRLMEFFDILAAKFPHHKLLTSDFHSLPDAVPGFNAPVVQTRYKRRTIPVSTPLVQQGFFDILFPTDFTVMEDVYRAITGKLTRSSSQEEFLKHWAYVEDTQTKNGENPMLSWYENASVMATL